VSPFERYQELQRYVGWTEADAARVRALKSVVGSYFPALVDDFYREIKKHPAALKVITGGDEQIARLKTTLMTWLEELFAGPYDEIYVERRWRVGHRHVQIGLLQVFTNAALSRLRRGLLATIEKQWPGDVHELLLARESLNTLLDLDLTIIEDAYQSEFQRRQLMHAEERARQAERLAAIGETMTALVHESRNALQRSKANLEMLSEEVEDRPEALKLVERVEKAQEDLHQLFEEVRQWAAPLNLRREECNLRQLWREVWSNVVHAQSAKKLRLDEKSPETVTVSVDRFAMGQVFRNIFENAVEASPADEAVEIACYDATNDLGDSVVISIADRGPGLSAEQQHRIFEPFFTTKTKGTGLGMAIASRIVQSHGGSIAASSPGGARIEITLPRNDQ